MVVVDLIDLTNVNVKMFAGQKERKKGWYEPEVRILKKIFRLFMPLLESRQ